MLKYAPLKSDFVRAVAQDDAIKKSVSDDMYSVPNETIIEAEAEEIKVDTETGEIVD